MIIVVPGDDPPQLQGSPHLQRLQPYGEIRLYRTRPIDADDQMARAAEAACLINTRSSVKWPAEVLRRLPNLRMITVCGIGTDAIDLAAARDLGIVVCNLPGRTAPIVAEHAFGMMFALAKRAWFQTSEVKCGRWTGMDNYYLQGKTMGIVGTGHIGGQMARLGRAVGMRVIAWTLHPSSERARELGVVFVDLVDLLRASDVVSLHVKLTDDTRGLIGAREIGLMRRGTLLVNTARGAVVNDSALVDALQSGHLGGAALDVFEVEPLPVDHPILSCDHVILTPHNADQTPEGMELLNGGVVDNVIAFLEGRPVNVVN